MEANIQKKIKGESEKKTRKIFSKYNEILKKEYEENPNIKSKDLM